MNVNIEYRILNMHARLIIDMRTISSILTRTRELGSLFMHEHDMCDANTQS